MCVEHTVVTVFRSRLRNDAGEDYERVANATEELARTMDGFVEFKTFTAEDGERCSVVIFSSEEAQEAWRRHPEHVEAQRLGRSLFYASYDILVCHLHARRRFTHDENAAH